MITNTNSHEQSPPRELVKKPETTPKLSISSLAVIILSTLLLRVAGRVSFIILTFYLGEHFESAFLVTLVLESYYLTELFLSPIIGSLSDRFGRRPFLVFGPLPAAIAVFGFFTISRIYPSPNADQFNLHLLILLGVILVGRLLEGATTGMNVPGTLGYFTDVTIGSEKLRAKVNTAFEVVTVAGLALAIPLGGAISKMAGTTGFLIVLALYLTIVAVSFFGIKESHHIGEQQTASHPSIWEGFAMIRHRRIFTFIPAWFAVNALIGALPNQILLIMTYPEPAASARHPGQLFYGGFDRMASTMWVGLFALFFLIGMGLWMFIVPRMRRSTVMYIGLSGLALLIASLSIVNSLSGTMESLPAGTLPFAISMLVLAVVGLLLLAGFTPVALSQMNAIAESMPGKRGAVMGLYSVVLGIGQALGQGIGSIFVDWQGFYGLMTFSALMLIVSLISVTYMRVHKDDLLATAAH